MIVDSLAFVGESIFGRGQTVEQLLDRLDGAGIDRAVVAPAKPPAYHLGPANDVVADAVVAHADRLAGLARVDPLQAGAAAELQRALELGLCGVFLHPWEETFRINDPCVDSVVEVARTHGVPVVIAAGYPWLSEGLQVGALAQRFPDVRFVATNGLQINIAGLGQQDAELAIADNPNLALQTAGVYREDFLEGIVERYGVERLLYASAAPQFEPRLELLRVRWAHFDDAQQRALLGANAARLFGLE